FYPPLACPPPLYSLSLHDALPISIAARFVQMADCVDGSWNTADSGSRWVGAISAFVGPGSLRSGFMSFEFPGSGSKLCTGVGTLDRKSTRLNSSHQIISYDVFCLK